MVRKKNKKLYINRYLITKLINKFLRKGKKVKVQNFFFSIIMKLQLLLKRNIFYLFFWSFRLLYPFVDFFQIKRRKSKRRWQILRFPRIIGRARRVYVALNWFVQAVRQNKFKGTFIDRFILEFFNLMVGRSFAIEKRNLVILEIMEQQKLQHFRWRRRRNK